MGRRKFPSGLYARFRHLLNIQDILLFEPSALVYRLCQTTDSYTQGIRDAISFFLHSLLICLQRVFGAYISHDSMFEDWF